MTELDSSDVVRARLDFAYDGGAYLGWAEQPSLPTVQGTLQQALDTVLRLDQPVRVTVAGRTDAGVHARGQVAHLDIPAEAWTRLPGRSSYPPESSLALRVNGVLPQDIRVTGCRIAPPGFDARWSARERRYAYRVSDRPETRDPLQRGFVMWHRREVDVAALNRASAVFLGLNEFAPFCRPREGATTVRDLREFTWERPQGGPDAGLVVATVRADAFCHSMVRSLVGAVIQVGEGRRDHAWLDQVASHPTRHPGVKVAPARGLTLESVEYPPDHEVAAQAVATRTRRYLT